jgi:hypothetical protein
MTSPTITLTKFDVTRSGYRYNSTDRAILTSDTENTILDFMVQNISKAKTNRKEPLAWSFSEWHETKETTNKEQFWLRSTAIALEYRYKDKDQNLLEELNERALALGEAHTLIDSTDRSGKRTATIVFYLSETVDRGQYARLSKIRMHELGFYGAASGNCAMTHLIHINENSDVLSFEGTIISPRSKIKETSKMYQDRNPDYFCARGPTAAVQLAPQMITSEDNLFEFPLTARERESMNVDAMLLSMGMDLSPFSKFPDA